MCFWLKIATQIHGDNLFGTEYILKPCEVQRPFFVFLLYFSFMRVVKAVKVGINTADLSQN